MPQYPASNAVRLRYILVALSVFFLLSLLAACGGGNNANKVTALLLGDIDPVSQTFASLGTQSLQQGQTLQLTTQIKNPKGAVIFPAVTWASNNPQVASVSTNGNLCGGTWDANFITCTPGPITATPVTITASAGGQSAAIAVSVHSRISKVTITPASSASACTSQTHTLQFTSNAFDVNGNDITASTGTPTFTVSDTTVASVDANGLVTAKNSGATGIRSAVGGVTSAPATFITCPPAKIVLHKSGDPAGTVTTAFNLTIGATATLVADITDTLGNPVTGLTLTYSSAQPAAASISGTTLTGVAVGSSTLLASCLPPGCNPNNGFSAAGAGVALYSNMDTATVTGTAASTTVYVTGITAADATNTNTSLLPIDTSTNKAGTAITLPGVPNSMAIAPKGDLLYVGTASGLAIIATATNTLSTTVTNAVGSILAVSPSGAQVVTFDGPNNRALLFDNTASPSTVTQIAVAANISSAAFSPDGYKVFITANGKVFELVPGGVTHSTPVTGIPTTVTVVPQGVLAYASPTASNQISSIAVCNDTVVTTPGVTAAPSLLRASPDGTELIGVGANWVLQPYAITGTLCPPTAIPEPAATTPAYAGSTPTQLIISPSQNFAVASSAGAAASATINFLDLKTGTPGTAPLAAGGTGTATTGGVTLEGSKLYIGLKGGSGNAVHQFDLTQNPPADTAQIPLTFTPDFVVVKP